MWTWMTHERWKVASKQEGTLSSYIFFKTYLSTSTCLIMSWWHCSSWFLILVLDSQRFAARAFDTLARRGGVSGTSSPFAGFRRRGPGDFRSSDRLLAETLRNMQFNSPSFNAIYPAKYCKMWQINQGKNCNAHVYVKRVKQSVRRVVLGLLDALPPSPHIAACFQVQASRSERSWATSLRSLSTSSA